MSTTRLVNLIATGGTIAITILDAKTAERLVNIDKEPSARELVQPISGPR